MQALNLAVSAVVGTLGVGILVLDPRADPVALGLAGGLLAAGILGLTGTLRSNPGLLVAGAWLLVPVTVPLGLGYGWVGTLTASACLAFGARQQPGSRLTIWMLRALGALGGLAALAGIGLFARDLLRGELALYALAPVQIVLPLLIALVGLWPLDRQAR